MDTNILEPRIKEFSNKLQSLSQLEFTDEKAFEKEKNSFNTLFKQINEASDYYKSHHTFYSFETFKKYLKHKMSTCNTADNPYTETMLLKKVHKVYSKYNNTDKIAANLRLRDENIYKPFYFRIYLEEDNLRLLASNTFQKIDFLEQELFERGIKVEKGYDEQGYEVISYSEDFSKKMQYLKGNAKKSIDNPEQTSIKKLNWSGTYLELAEVLKALIETKKFVGHKDKEVFELFSEFLNIKTRQNKKRETLATIKKRTKDKAPFLDQLYINLEKWIDDKDNP